MRKLSELNTADLDSRLVLKIYAIFMTVMGLLLLGWGPMWFGADLPGIPWGRAVALRLLGGALLGAAGLGYAAMRVSDDDERDRLLLWLLIGHLGMGFLAQIQIHAVFAYDLHGPWEVATLHTGCFLAIARGMTRYSENVQAQRPISLFDAPQPRAERLRTEYERRIREAAGQEERHRLARDLHDSVKQQIFAMQTNAATAQARFDGDPDGAREALERVRASAREAMTEMQVMLDQLRAAPLTLNGLVEALRTQAEALGFRSGARVEVEIGELPRDEEVPPAAPEMLFRACQEALSNVARHARASSVCIRLAAAGTELMLVIADDGAGFDPDTVSMGMGLRNLRTRAEELGGTFELVSAPGRGVSITIRIPGASQPGAQRWQRMDNVLVNTGTLFLIWANLTSHRVLGSGWLSIDQRALMILVAMTFYAASLGRYLFRRFVRQQNRTAR